MHLSIHLSIYLSSIYLSQCVLSISVCSYLCIISIYLSIYIYIYIYIYIFSPFLSICLSVLFLSIYLSSLFQFIYLSIYLSISGFFVCFLRPLSLSLSLSLSLFIPPLPHRCSFPYPHLFRPPDSNTRSTTPRARPSPLVKQATPFLSLSPHFPFDSITPQPFCPLESRYSFSIMKSLFSHIIYLSII
ncbi:unnamed protein product [Acanthosepion pharaonis]|uniref:Uncharacterized protein n=1 Tax=Acanthosepion pharaonis TaxID=158019 RepID=A0A812DNE4_ACAPH|nr:unnamed protein product [Sepia pharaonis]